MAENGGNMVIEFKNRDANNNAIAEMELVGNVAHYEGKGNA